MIRTYKKIQYYMLNFIMLIFVISILSISPTYSKYQSINDIDEISIVVTPPDIDIFAVYSDTDKSLRFFNRKQTLIQGDTFTTLDGQEIVATNVYTGIAATTTIPWEDKKTQVSKISVEDEVSPANITGWFNNCSNATELDLSNLNTLNVADMSDMFSGCTNLDVLKLGESFGTSEQTFESIGLNKFITGWTKASENGTENDGVDHLSKNISLGVAETYTSVTYCYAIYSNNTGDNILSIYQRKYVPETNSYYNDGKRGLRNFRLVSWRVGNKNESPLSQGCKAPRDYNTGNVISTTWSTSTSFTHKDVKLVDVRDNIQPTTMDSWFYEFQNCEEFVLEKLDTSQTTSMSYMFFDANKIEVFDLRGFDTLKVEDMSYMFAKCWNLEEAILTSFDTSSVTNMSSMFSMVSSTGLTSNLTTIYVSEKFVTTNVTKSGSMFARCYNLAGGNGTTLESTKVDGTYVVDKTYALIDKPGQPGYFTLKEEVVA